MNTVDVELHVVPFICKPICGQRLELAQATFEHLVTLNLADSSKGDTELKIDMLLGADFYWDFVTNDIIRGKEGPVAVRTSLGWVLNGKMNEQKSEATASHLVSAHVMLMANDDETLDNLLRQFWKLDDIGNSDENEADVLANFKETVKFENGRYVVSLPWKKMPDILPDNYQLCRARLLSLLKRLRGNPILLKEYDDILKKQQEDGIIEDADETSNEPGSVHYIPHREIVRKDRETTKVRLVYDAGAKLKGRLSLNDCLEKGPCMLQKIFDVLVRFRSYAYAVTSDIQSAFLNIRVNDNDRDYLRFLWIDDIHRVDPQIIMKRFTSVLFGLGPSPFLLGATVSTH